MDYDTQPGDFGGATETSDSILYLRQPSVATRRREPSATHYAAPLLQSNVPSCAQGQVNGSSARQTQFAAARGVGGRWSTMGGLSLPSLCVCLTVTPMLRWITGPWWVGTLGAPRHLPSFLHSKLAKIRDVQCASENAYLMIRAPLECHYSSKTL